MYNKVRGDKMQFVCIFFHICWSLQKIWIFNFPRYCSSVPKARRVMSCGFWSKFRAVFSRAKILKIG